MRNLSRVWHAKALLLQCDLNYSTFLKSVSESHGWVLLYKCLFYKYTISDSFGERNLQQPVHFVSDGVNTCQIILAVVFFFSSGIGVSTFLTAVIMNAQLWLKIKECQLQAVYMKRINKMLNSSFVDCVMEKNVDAFINFPWKSF